MTNTFDRKELLSILSHIEEQILYYRKKIKYQETMKEIIFDLLSQEN